MRVTLDSGRLASHAPFINRLSSKHDHEKALIEVRDGHANFWLILPDGVVRVNVPAAGETVEEGSISLSVLTLRTLFKFFSSEIPAPELSYSGGTLAHVNWNTGSCSFPLMQESVKAPILATEKEVLRIPAPLALKALDDLSTVVSTTSHQIAEYAWLRRDNDSLFFVAGDGYTVLRTHLHGAKDIDPGSFSVHSSAFVAMLRLVSGSPDTDELVISTEPLTDSKFYMQAQCGDRLVRMVSSGGPDKYLAVLMKLSDKTSEDAISLPASSLHEVCRYFKAVAAKETGTAPAKFDFGPDGAFVRSSNGAEHRLNVSLPAKASNIVLDITRLTPPTKSFEQHVDFEVCQFGATQLAKFSGPTAYGWLDLAVAPMKEEEAQ